ncbi:MAG: hypothetical protein HYV26_11830 [Candidatus Hydrogenedentes bacterium]|nr:hypothetical protein [Candidatus Hydrogenedentota bacterium]
MREIREAVAADDFDHARRELGDLLLITVNLARFLDTDPAEALRAATARFSARFSALKREVAREGRTVEACTLEELDAVWNRIKNHAITAIEKRA